MISRFLCSGASLNIPQLGVFVKGRFRRIAAVHRTRLVKQIGMSANRYYVWVIEDRFGSITPIQSSLFH